MNEPLFVFKTNFCHFHQYPSQKNAAPAWSLRQLRLCKTGLFQVEALYLKLEQMEIDKKEQEQLATEADLLPMQKFRLNVVFTLKQ